MRIARLVLVALLVVACGGGSLTISGPAGGTHVSGPTVIVTGTAPPNTEVTQDVSARPDRHTLSDAQGNWRIEADLDVGENVLTFRIGSDESTEKQILVIRDQ